MERTRGTRRHHGASRELRRGQDPVRRTARTVRRGARSLKEEVSGQRSFTICGPTASGKSQLADLIAEHLSDLRGYHVPVIVVDSMQVYEEIPKVTNQDRGRPAELLGVVPVSEEWTMARHRAAADAVVATTEGPFVLDAGTGMYLNALIFDLPIYRRVAPEIRKEAARLTRDAENPRRAARKRELELSGESLRGSIWEGELRYDLSLIYLRPDKSLLDDAIKRRSSRITRDGIQEATRLVERLRSGETMNPSVAQSIGVRELMAHVRGEINIREAEERISARTRQLARRQMRWFDKLSKTLRGRAAVLTIRDTSLLSLLRDPAELLSSIAPRKQQI